MITKRIIPCLDVKDGRVVKGVNFENLNDVSSPVELGKYYSDCGADELVFYDITASSDGRRLFTDILRQVAENIFIPLTVGGGINTLDDFDRVLKCGADKVSVNSGAIKNPELIKSLSDENLDELNKMYDEIEKRREREQLKQEIMSEIIANIKATVDISEVIQEIDELRKAIESLGK